jgi:nicotinate phosphoribosyltransferase
MHSPIGLEESNGCLFTDLYELTMLQSYFNLKLPGKAVFDFLVRKLPENWNYLLVCGLENVLDYLEKFRFDEKAIDYLDKQKLFSSVFLDYLKGFHFTGDVYAMEEGRVAFSEEPLLEVQAPIMEAQLFETLILNQIHYQTLAASKCSRVVQAAEGRSVVDYGLRRIHGFDAGIKSARAFYVGGIDSTSNVFGGFLYNIPISGTMAHSYIQAHRTEEEAFENFRRSFPETILLVYTFYTLAGVRRVIEMAKKNGPDFKITGIRLDSGDLADLAKKSRALLDEAGLQGLKIVASGGLDEYKIGEMVQAGAPIDGFGVGTKMGVASDHPYLDCAYKMKLSAQKRTLPGRKQVFRLQAGEAYCQDEIACFSEKREGEPLLKKVMEGGKRLEAPSDLDTLRERAQENLARLPGPLRSCGESPPYPVLLSPEMDALVKGVARDLRKVNRV